MPRNRFCPIVPVSASPSLDGDKLIGPRSSKGARTRERLIEAAKAAFQERGFVTARITDIAERAGQSHASFYYYFDSKEAIFREVAAAVDQRLSAPLQDVIMAPSKLPPAQRMAEALRRHFEIYRQEARIMDLIEHVARVDAEVNALRQARHQRYTEQIAGTIRQLQQRKLADPSLDADVTAAAIGALTHRFAQMWIVNGAIDCTHKQAIEQLSRIFANTLGLRPAGHEEAHRALGDDPAQARRYERGPRPLPPASQ